MSTSKVAILIDGGFFTQRFKAQNKGATPARKDVESLILDIMSKVQHCTGGHSTDVLLRSYYYDCYPFGKEIKNLKGKKVDYSQGAVYKNQTAYLDSLKMIDQFALRT